MIDLSQLQFSSEYPGFYSVVFTTLCAIILGTLIAFTYEKTTSAVGRPNHFLQAIILITIVSSMIIQAIGDSVARGLGMIGALSIIRFRTTIKDPRNIVFIFSAIAVGIACGVFGFTIAVVGTVGFCLTAFLLKYSTFTRSESQIATINLQISKSLGEIEDVKAIIRAHTIDNRLIKKSFGVKKKSDTITLNYKLKFKDDESAQSLLNELNGLPGVATGTLNFIEPEIEDI